MFKINPITGKLDLVGGESSFPDYPIGSRQSFTNTFGIIAAQVAAANIIYGSILYIPKKVSLDEMTIRTLAAVAGNAVVGIYKYTADGTANGQWDLIEQIDPATPFNTGIIANQSVLLTNPVTLEPGVYSFCWHSNVAVAIYQQIYYANTTLGGYNTNLSTTAYNNAITSAAAYSANMPLQLVTPIISALGYTPLITAKVI